MYGSLISWKLSKMKQISCGGNTKLSHHWRLEVTRCDALTSYRYLRSEICGFCGGVFFGKPKPKVTQIYINLHLKRSHVNVLITLIRSFCVFTFPLLQLMMLSFYIYLYMGCLVGCLDIYMSGGSRQQQILITSTRTRNFCNCVIVNFEATK